MSTATTANWRKLVSTIRYRENWNFMLMPDGKKLRLRAWVEDSTKPGHMAYLTMYTGVDQCKTEQELIEHVFASIRKMEEHEAAEFYLVANTAPFDPHAAK